MFSSDIISSAQHKEWWQKLQSDSSRKAFIYLLDDEPVGFFILEQMYDQMVRWGFYKAPIAKNGIGFEMGKTVVDSIFQQSNTQKIMGQVLPCNIRSIRLHEKLGFERVPTQSDTSRNLNNLKNFKKISYVLDRNYWQS